MRNCAGVKYPGTSHRAAAGRVRLTVLERHARTIYQYTRGPAQDCLRRSSFALGVRGASRP
eukprot:4558367-Prymnesium_polylepis.1